MTPSDQEPADQPAEQDAPPRPRPSVDSLPTPVDLPRLIKATWGLYRRRHRLWIPASFVAYALFNIVHAAAIEFVYPALSEGAAQLLDLFIGAILLTAVGSAVIAFLVPAMAASTLDSSIDFRESLRRARSRARHPLTALPYALFVGVAMTLPPFVFLLAVIGNALPLAAVAGPPILIHAVVHEGIPVRDAWRRTREVMRGQWLRVLMNILTLTLGLGILQFPYYRGVGVTLDALGISGDLLVVVVIVFFQTLFAGFAFPLVFLAWWVSYLDARARNENFDRAGLEREVAEVAAP